MSTTLALTAKSIWVIGGAGYLGSPIVEALDATAKQVGCCDLGNRARDLVRERKLTRTIPVSLDVTDLAAIETRLQQLIAEHGLPDGVAHLAYTTSAGKRVDELALAEFQRCVGLALTSAFALGRLLAEKMKARG